MNPLVDLLAGRAVPRSGAVALVHDGRATSHDELHDLAARLAAALAVGSVGHGVGPGDRVVTAVPASLDAVASHLAILRAGAVHVPVDPTSTEAEIAVRAADCGARLVLRQADLDALVASASAAAPADPSPREAADPACILYTSGTTGAPKGAVLSHGNLVANAHNLMSAWGFTPDDVLVHVLPLTHTHGLFVALHTTLAAGGTVRLLGRFDAAATLDALPGATVLMGVPTHYTRLLDHPGFDRGTAGRLRLMTSGSAPMSPRTHEAVRERTGHTVLERYGMTEASIITSNPLHGERRPGTVGFPLPGVGLRVVDGAVEVSGPTVFQGYHGRPEAQAEAFTPDGWLRTGDLGRLDDDGYLTLIGRSKDLVITGGLNVVPGEVEAVLDALDGVAESAVVGQPDPDLGERVVAFVVPAPGADPDPEDLRAACRTVLSGYKVPKRIEIVDGLPRNALGKVLRTALREAAP